MKRVDFPASGEVLSLSPEETADFARGLAGRLKPGSIVTLKGGLGAGKTAFAGGIARALGIEAVTSPTYTIINEYEGYLGGSPLPFYHMDAFRLSGNEDFRQSGGEELLYNGGICVIEWPERLTLLPEKILKVEIAILETGALAGLHRRIRWQDAFAP